MFTSGAFAELKERWGFKQRFGAVGKHGSVAVTERVIKTLKYEWLHRVPVIRGLDHLSGLLDDFGAWYNDYRGHMTLGGATPTVIHQSQGWQKPERSAKVLPPNIERRVFADTRVTAYWLAE
ncbi:MAG TPA: integrase core domain-containing protein [Phycisphaerae bacterium]|nr:integrase core domain-containing protein [Phycisphaerae bacterium]